MGVVGVVNVSISRDKLILLSKYIFNRDKIFIVDNEKIEDKRTINTILKNIVKNMSTKKFKELLLIANINELDLKKKANELSTTETAKVKLAMALLDKPEIIIIDSIDKYLIESNLKKLNKTINLIKKKSNIKIMVVSKNIMFLKQICDFYYLVNDEFIYSTNNFKELFSNEELIPDLYSFLELSRIYGHDLNKYDEVKEIIKAIYRGE